MNRLIDRFSRHFRQKSIQYVISVSFTLATVSAMIFVGLALFLRFTDGSQNIIMEDNKRILNQASIALDTHLRAMMRVSDSMYYLVIKNKDLETESIEQEMNLLYETNRNAIISIALFTGEGKLQGAAPVSIPKKDVNYSSKDWFTTARYKIENMHFSQPHVQNLFEDSTNKYRWVVSLSRSVELTKNGRSAGGVLLVDMSFSEIEQIFSGTQIGKTGYMYLTDDSGELIYHPRQQLIYSAVQGENHKVNAFYEDGSHIEEFEGKKRIVTVKTAGYTGWKIIGVTPMEDVTASYSNMGVFALFILLFSIFIISFINLFISSRIADPIKALEHAVRKIEGGAENVNVSVGGSYEVQHLGMAIGSMVSQLRTLMSDIRHGEEEKRKSELDVLQSQINPHFLYNTLDSIIWMIENENYDDSIQMVTALAKLFRISLSSGKNIISLEDEIDHGKNYLLIQKIRYKNRFEIKMDISPETLQLGVIKLVVQPILENAIYHGLEFMDGDGLLTVRSYIQEQKLFIEIGDNGLGLTPEKMDSLFSRNVQPRGRGSGIGLRNIHQRIQLYFGPEYGLSIDSEPDEGTRVTLCLPAMPLHEMEENQHEKQ